ncbi:MAG TPA: hypothetical protein VK186_20805, partial [Candidatus Deferrimicrobium sp.]|nr:hypothetical protein [Candidatus Deferrimicrobium sp.]
MKMKIHFTLLGIMAVMGFLAAMGCGNPGKEAAMTVQKGTFEIVIPAFGELDAVKSTPILASAQIRGQQTIAWIAPENSRVKAGETVIR